MSDIKVIFGPMGDFGVLKALYRRIATVELEFNLLYNDSPEIIVKDRQYKVPYLSELEMDEFIDRVLRGDEAEHPSILELPVVDRQYPPSQGVATAF